MHNRITQLCLQVLKLKKALLLSHQDKKKRILKPSQGELQWKKTKKKQREYKRIYTEESQILLDQCLELKDMDFRLLDTLQ